MSLEIRKIFDCSASINLLKFHSKYEILINFIPRHTENIDTLYTQIMSLLFFKIIATFSIKLKKLSTFKIL